ncbi:MAG TPA: class I SAM-dependent methyltransferase [Caulobacteraceae bacterium]|jgi:methyltransferase (TIGR00027 family)|nr:class I SAM-dependent methyltransferase [Caulobacteraceae bacterium]
MQIGQPSRTAQRAAAHRAAHQLLEQGRIFHDPLAVRILGESPGTLEAEAAANPGRRGMRLFIAARARFAESAVEAAFGRGVRQLVVLGAGLDTFAYRNPHADLRVFEVDHPATQGWKRERLTEAGIAQPESMRFAPVDFEHVSLAEGLAAAGFDPAAPAIFTWLGVVTYLTEAAVFATLGFIAGLAAGSEVVFTYSDPPEARPVGDAAAHQRRAARVEALGEPWLTYFTPQALHPRLRALGFGEIEDLDPAQVSILYFGAPAGAPDRKGGHLIRARLT